MEKAGTWSPVRRQRRTAVQPVAVATVKHVAELAGVSTATVSRTLSGVSAVREPLRTKVLDAARLLGYHPNRAARELRAGGSRTVGVLIPDIENSFFTSVVRGVEDTLHQAGYTLLLANYNEDPERESAQLATFRAEGVGGLIFAPSRQPAALYRTLSESGLPMVGVSRVHQRLRVDQVTVGDREGSRDATAHLIRRGHSRIALITGPTALSTSRERRQGYEDALREAGVALDEQLAVHCDFRQQAGYESMRHLLDLPVRPTAVFAGNNLLALGALQAIHETDLNIPEQIAIVGFDEMPWAMSLRPPVTTVAQPATEVGRTAAELLLDRIRTPDRPRQQVVLGTKLIVRASSGEERG